MNKIFPTGKFFFWEARSLLEVPEVGSVCGSVVNDSVIYNAHLNQFLLDGEQGRNVHLVLQASNDCSL